MIHGPRRIGGPRLGSRRIERASYCGNWSALVFVIACFNVSGFAMADWILRQLEPMNQAVVRLPRDAAIEIIADIGALLTQRRHAWSRPQPRAWNFQHPLFRMAGVKAVTSVLEKAVVRVVPIHPKLRYFGHVRLVSGC